LYQRALELGLSAEQPPVGMRWEPRPASASEMAAEKWPAPSLHGKPIPMGSTGSEARSVFPPQGSVPDRAAVLDQVAGLDQVAVLIWK
jgi:hypothetical protein